MRAEMGLCDSVREDASWSGASNAAGSLPPVILALWDCSTRETLMSRGVAIDLRALHVYLMRHED